MYKMLWVSPYAPYDTVTHAGGKVHNYYVKYLHKSKRYDITLLSICLQEEEPKLDLDEYGIKNHIFVMDRTKGKKFLRRAVSAWSFVNPFDKYAGTCLDYERTNMLKMLREYQAEQNVPDIVMLQWTFAVMLTPVIRKMFPQSTIVAIEEDVTFLGYKRRWKAAKGHYERWFWKRRYQHLKKLEISMLQQCDLVVTNNPKDEKLLRDNGIDRKKLFRVTSYFDDYSHICRESIGKEILFYGDMSRAENYLSACWLIDHVLPMIEDREARIVILGSHPTKALLQRQSDRVKVTGFVEDVSSYFTRAACFAAPLQLGAGIKIKILEAMSAGLPVLTNQIGMEGIGAVDGKDYIHCETAQEYAMAINRILNGTMDAESISQNGRRFIKDNFHIQSRLDKLMDRIEQEKSKVKYDKENS